MLTSSANTAGRTRPGRVWRHTLQKPKPRVGHHRDGHDESEYASSDADDALREGPGRRTHSVTGNSHGI